MFITNCVTHKYRHQYRRFDNPPRIVINRIPASIRVGRTDRDGTTNEDIGKQKYTTKTTTTTTFLQNK